MLKTSREILIKSFLEKNNVSDYTINKIAGDASFRSYYRIFRDKKDSLILMDAPPEYENVEPFVKIDLILRENNFLAPEIFAKDIKNGFLLLQDFGDLSLNKALENQELSNKELDLYKKSTDILLNLHQVEGKHNLENYDSDLLLKEVELFIDWYLPFIIKKPANKVEKEILKQNFKKLFSKLSGEKALVLRDYHADNLFIYQNKIALLDFQDAVLGSKAYDLVSLLEDARRVVKQDTVKSIIDYYLIKSNVDKDIFLQDYKILSLQRNIKIIGIFSRLAIRDKKENYLNMIPKILNYVSNRLEDKLFDEIKEVFNKLLK